MTFGRALFKVTPCPHPNCLIDTSCFHQKILAKDYCVYSRSASIIAQAGTPHQSIHPSTPEITSVLLGYSVLIIPRVIDQLGIMSTTNMEEWSSYLKECGLTTNPFQRSQWKTDPSTLRNAFGLNGTGASMSFNLSADTKEHLLSDVNATEYPRIGKDQVNVLAISSLPGGGKTRLLLELLGILPSNFDAIYYISFNNQSRLSPDFDAMESRIDTERSIAMRILYQGIQMQGRPTPEKMEKFHDWLGDLEKKKLGYVTKIAHAIQLLHGDMKKTCVLAVDEANQIEEEELIRSDIAMANLVKVLGEAMVRTRVFSLMAGTLIGKFDIAASKSTFRLRTTYLQSLTTDQQYSILDHYPSLAGWLCSEGARYLLSLLGGLPRLLEVFIMEILEASRYSNKSGKINWKEIPWGSVRHRVDASTSAKSFRIPMSVEAGRKLIDNIMLRKSVESAEFLVDGEQTTYESLQQNSMISLQPLSNDYQFIPTMPLIAFRSLVRRARGSEHSRFQRLDKLMDMDSLGPSKNWAGFERFCIDHTALMNDFFANDQKEGQSELPLSRRYAPGYGNTGDIKIETFLSKHPEVFKCSHKFPSTSSSIVDEKGLSRDFEYGNCYLNAPGASFADGFYVCMAGQTDSDTTEDEEMTDFASENEDAAAEDGSKVKLFIAEQYKCRDTDVSFETGIKEHKKNMKGWRNKNISGKDGYRVITIVITTSKISPPHPNDLRKKRDLLVIDVTMFKDYYGILTPLIRTDRIAINTVEFSKLKELFTSFGSNIAEKIVQARSDGFTSEEAFRARMREQGVSTEGQKWENILNRCDF